MLWEQTNHPSHIYKQTYLFACSFAWCVFFTLVIDWMLTNRSHLLRRPSNRNEFIEAITIKRRILLSVYKFITGAFTLAQNVYNTYPPYKCVPLAYRFAFMCMTTKTASTNTLLQQHFLFIIWPNWIKTINNLLKYRCF